MRGFKNTRPYTAVTLESGDESITLKVYARSPLFDLMMDRLLPLTEDGDQRRSYLRGAVALAESLKDEEIPSSPNPASSTTEDWEAYAREVLAALHDAGFTQGHIITLIRAASEITNSRHPGKESVVGNSSAPPPAPGDTSGS